MGPGSRRTSLILVTLSLLGLAARGQEQSQATATNQFLRNDGAGTLSWREALVNFTESTVSVSGQRSVTLAATNAATNVWAVLQPKGTGGVQADTPDGAAAGGNIRGAYAVDWQGERTAATQVASGNTATIGGGRRNTASAGSP